MQWVEMLHRMSASKLFFSAKRAGYILYAAGLQERGPNQTEVKEP